MSKKTISLKPKAKPDNVIGIDPDAVKSGIAFLEIGTRKLECSTLRFCDLMEYLKWAKGVAESKSQSFVVVIEGGWLNAGNWHLPKVCSKQKAAAQGRSVGMNHQTGILIAEFCEHHGIPFEIVKPLQKIWRGADRKITHEELVAICDHDHVLTRTNQEQRDAALLAWWYAGLPIRITKTKNNDKR